MFLRAWKKFRTALESLGERRCYSEDDRFRLQRTNWVLFILAASTFPYVGPLWLAGLHDIATAALIVAISWILLLPLNLFGYVRVTIVLSIIELNLILLYFSCALGRESALPLCYFAATILPLAVSTIHDRKTIAFGLALPVICYAALQVTGYQIFANWGLSLAMQRHLHMVIFTGIFALVFGTSLFYFVANEGTKQKLKAEIQERIALEKERETTRLHLNQATKMAALGEMAGSMAHEINTPLSVVIARARHIRIVVERDPVDWSKIDEFSRAIEKSGHEIEHIIQGLLSFARPASHGTLENIALSEILRSTLLLCAARFKESGIDLRVVGLNQGIHIECLPSQLSQAILNILNNAFDAVRPLDKKWVEIAIKDTVDSAKISVTDSGAGIQKQIADRIMEPFFTTKPFQGTGIGLSAAKGIIEAHGGTLYLDTGTKNTCFVIIIPKRYQQRSGMNSAA